MTKTLIKCELNCKNRNGLGYCSKKKVHFNDVVGCCEFEYLNQSEDLNDLASNINNYKDG